MYDVNNVSSLLGVSTVTVYKKIKKLDELKKFIVIKDGKTYVLKEGVDVLRGKIASKPNVFKEEIKEKEIENVKEDQFINMLKEQLKEKDQQIKEKDNQINELIGLNKNSQILIKQQQDKEMKQLQLEAHFEDVDKKLIELKEQMNNKRKRNRWFCRK